MRVKEVMEKNIVGVAVETRADSALRLMKSMRVSLMPVLSQGKLVGVIHEKDFGELQDSEKAGSVMRKPIFVEEEANTDDAVKKMIENAVGRIPVVNNKRDMLCVGTVSSTEIVKSKK